MPNTCAEERCTEYTEGTSHLCRLHLIEWRQSLESDPLVRAALALEEGAAQGWSRDELGRCHWCRDGRLRMHMDGCEFVAFMAAIDAYRAVG